jgi:hypothetical protein
MPETIGLGLLNRRVAWWAVFSFCGVVVISTSTPAQSDSRSRLSIATGAGDKSSIAEVKSDEDQRRLFAVSIVNSLALEARSYADLALRARVLARAAVPLASR